ncbi:MAG: GAF domain-containing protein, partial [Spirochaetales bacterium]|nr:GAF domain-containing protein [Spirochaetales bacterium]
MHKYSDALTTLSTRASLFESDREMNGFLKEAISRLIELSGSSLGAVYVYDESSRELVFRVGYDRDDFWDSFRCSGKKAPLSFSLENSDPGRAFRETQVRILEYSSEKEIRSKLIIPIVRGPEKLGVLMLAHRQPGAFNRENLSDLKRAVS